jgi:hypothetical protein
MPKWALVALLALLAWQSHGLAAENAGEATRPLVAIVGLGNDHPLAGQLALDLSMLGFAVQMLADPAADEATVLASYNAVAVLAFQRDGLALATKDDPQSSFQELAWPREATLAQARITSQKVVEVLRAKLRRLPADEAAPEVAPPGKPVDIQPPTSASTTSPQRVWFVDAGPGVLHSLGGVPTQVGAVLSLGTHGSTWRGQLSAWLPLSQAVLSAAEGESRASAWAGFATLSRLLRAPTARLRPYVAAAAGVVHLRLTGEAQAPFVSANDNVTRVAVLFQLGLLWRLSQRWHLRPHAFVGSLGPAVAVEFAGRQVADFGQTMLGGGLALEYRLP